MPPRVYVGQTRSRALMPRLGELGWGEVAQRGELPPRHTPWFFDCGAFRDWQAGTAFDAVRFTRNLWWIAHRLEAGSLVPPDFVVLPDLPARGLDSLAMSLRWLDEVADLLPRVPAFLVVQDGMRSEDVRPHLPRLGGLFVGGTVAWKRATLGQWCDLAHAAGKPCHVGRAASKETLGLAVQADADSIDSSLPLWSEENLARFRTHLATEDISTIAAEEIRQLKTDLAALPPSAPRDRALQLLDRYPVLIQQMMVRGLAAG